MSSDTNQILERKLPYNIEAEQILLGCILTNNDFFHKVSETLLEDHFYEPVHGRIFRYISKLIDKGVLADPITLKNYFENDPSLENYGKSNYLSKLASLASVLADVTHYATIISDLAIKRELILLGQDLITDSYNDKLDYTALEHIEILEQRLFNLASNGNAENGFKPLQSSLEYTLIKTEKAMKNQGSVSGASTGYVDLDRILGGFNNSDLIILAGRPSMGKTAFAMNLAVNVADSLAINSQINKEQPASVGFFSLEMSAEQLAARILSMESGISATHMRTGMISAEDFRLLSRANKKLQSMNLFIDDTPALSIAAIRARARRLKRKYNLSALFIDYLQLVRGTSKQSDGNRVQEVSEVTQGLKAIAKELNIPVIALSQLSRAVEQREDKRPMLSDLRESGSIEQDADIVMFIYREEYYLMRIHKEEGTEAHKNLQERLQKCQNKTEILIAKQRNGPIGNALLYFDSNTSKFKNLAKDSM